jgi:hypothetical protein
MRHQGRGTLATIAILVLIAGLLIGLKVWDAGRVLQVTIKNTGTVPISVVRASVPGLDVSRSINDSWEAPPGGQVTVPHKRTEQLIFVATDPSGFHRNAIRVSRGVNHVDVVLNADGSFSFTEH